MALKLEHVSIRLNDRTLIQPLSLSVETGETVALMGASGSGKSTLLSFIAGGLEPPFTATGKVSLDGVQLDSLPPEARHIGRLFQDDLLFPHLTVGENLLFGMPRGPRPARLARVDAALAEAELPGFGERPPHTLSGGQRARVALMRALVAEPRAMLLDEPFNKLDAPLRQAMRSFVFEHIAARGIPCLMVTHDEADVPPGGRVLRLKDGEVTHA
ncbi:MAG: ATP-binding cassette domain-containing protein [Aestuariivirga sp.]|uniref:ATP-binding cassette domain-containing protein n=1 Tax=Aestuariivirga sp. TaxID=2650926 RepID=UPI0025C447E7|nr:ATP-binding cassette domain-containing protein [Aestuariivirga sp.]MCA3562398.1 ATP-binding cassette domain-containing protein [Aestuariivirga sp.]